MARLYQKINNEAVPLGGGGGGSVAIDNVTITENSDDEIQVATTITNKINQLNNSASDTGKVLTANGNGTASWDDVLVPIDYETITKNSNGELQVSSVPYDNTTSGLEADNVQDAIDEVATNFANLGNEVVFSESTNKTITNGADNTVTEVNLDEGLYFVSNSHRYYNTIQNGWTIGATFGVVNGAYTGSQLTMKVPTNDYTIGASGLVKINAGGGKVRSIAKLWGGSGTYEITPSTLTIIRFK